MNLLLGFLLVCLLVGRMELVGTTTVAGFYPEATSDQWLQSGDTILEVNGSRVNGYNDAIYQMIRDQDGVLDFKVLREGEPVELTGVVFATREYEGGTRSLVLDFQFYGKEKTLLSALDYAFDWTVAIEKQIWHSLVDIVAGRTGFDQLSGPVGTSAAIGEAASAGVDSLVLLVALITVNVGIFNLLPVPALDGGRLLFLLIEIIIRRPIPQKYEALIHTVGLALLLGLVAVITLKDISGLFAS